MLRRLTRQSRRLRWIVLLLGGILALESYLHWRSYEIPKPGDELDPPFYSQCQEPPDVPPQRHNATFVMLARNSELEQVRHTVNQIETKFNRWYHYPIVFLNDEPWDPEFVRVLNQTASGQASFEVIPHEDWYFPEWMDTGAAKASMVSQGERGVFYGGLETYHHMCRFFSGKFYTLEALRKYKWYWRLEPDVDYYCSITYDPFAEMARHNKVYGWAMSLWEEDPTCPSLFRAVADWKESHMIPSTRLWTAMKQASLVPTPFRSMFNWLPHHDREGDIWSKCHYWSNFEIADLDFFRSQPYQELYEYLDKKGGFYFERWGDAAVHSLAVGALLDPSQVHHFADIGYRHDKLYQCPANAPGGQMDGSILLGDAHYAPVLEGGVGCRCECDGSSVRNYSGFCTNRLKQPYTRERTWKPWFLQ